MKPVAAILHALKEYENKPINISPYFREFPSELDAFKKLVSGVGLPAASVMISVGLYILSHVHHDGLPDGMAALFGTPDPVSGEGSDQPIG